MLFSFVSSSFGSFFLLFYNGLLLVILLCCSRQFFTSPSLLYSRVSFSSFFPGRLLFLLERQCLLSFLTSFAFVHLLLFYMKFNVPSFFSYILHMHFHLFFQLSSDFHMATQPTECFLLMMYFFHSDIPPS